MIHEYIKERAEEFEDKVGSGNLMVRTELAFMYIVDFNRTTTVGTLEKVLKLIGENCAPTSEKGMGVNRERNRLRGLITKELEIIKNN